MATLSSGDTISLKNIYSGSRFTGDLSSWDNVYGSYTPSTGLSLGFLQAWRNDAAGTLDTTIISMSAAAIDSVDGINGYTYLVENTSETYTISVSGAGWYAQDIFVDVGSTGNSAIWMDDPSNKFGSHYVDEAGARGNINGAGDSITGANVSNTDGVLDSVVSGTVKAKYADYVNDHATNYDTLLTKTIYWVDSYDGNATALCLTSDTPITLADGTTIEIGDAEEGMLLKGYNLQGLRPSSEMNMLDWTYDSELTPEEVDVEVVNIVFSFADRIYNINNGTLKATSEHPFVVNEDGIRKFKPVHLLKVGDYLIKADGTEEEITSIEIQEETVEIVSLDVNGPDTYLANGYITHNKGGNSHTDFSGPGAPSGISFTSGTNFLSWTAPTGTTTTGITAYDIQIDNNSDFSSPTLNITEYSTTSISLTSQLTSGTYYARVRAIESGLKSDWETIGGNNSSFTI